MIKCANSLVMEGKLIPKDHGKGKDLRLLQFELKAKPMGICVYCLGSGKASWKIRSGS